MHKQETVMQWRFWEREKTSWWKLCLENEQDGGRT